jgi:hypothetical protein
LTKLRSIHAGHVGARLGRIQWVFLVAIAAVVLIRLPLTLASDMRGARQDRHMSARSAAEARGPAALAGTDIALIRAARRIVPRDAPFAVVRGGRWGSALRPNHALAFVWESGESWTQFDLAPRLEVAPGRATWLLVRDATPRAAGVLDVRRQWRFGSDWLVERRAAPIVR